MFIRFAISLLPSPCSKCPKASDSTRARSFGAFATGTGQQGNREPDEHQPQHSESLSKAHHDKGRGFFSDGDFVEGYDAIPLCRRGCSSVPAIRSIRSVFGEGKRETIARILVFPYETGKR